MQRHLFGMITPSSNTILEPVTTAILTDIPNVSAHFSRFRVTQIGLSKEALGQFQAHELLSAADLLMDAKCEVIGWNGTSASWVGFDSDEKLCQQIEQQTGAKACTSVLALNEALQKTQIKRLGLITPYTTDVQQAIMKNYAEIGIQCIDHHFGISENYAFSEITHDQIRAAVDAMMSLPIDKRPEAITVLCTNVGAAPLAEEIEATYGVPLFDSISVIVWKTLRLAGIDPRLVKGWGKLFQIQ